MKNTIICVLVFCLFSVTELRANNICIRPSCTTDTLPTVDLISFLQQLSVQDYYGRPVDTLLLAIPANFYNMKVYGGSNSQGANFRASYLSVDFTANPAGPGIKIYVRQFNHLTRYSPTATWNISLFRLENIDRVEIWANQNICINGSCMQ
jgi:hypothetical protein